MRVLMVHNHYQQSGGEDQSFAAETELLRYFGEEVETWTVHNDDLKDRSAARLAAHTLWNAQAARELRRRVDASGPFDVIHFQNTFPLLSPATVSAAGSGKAAVVQSLRNYRLLCVNGMFFRAGTVCELCLDRRVQLPGIIYACYRGSVPASATVAAMNAFHRARGTHRRSVDVFIAPSDFAKGKLVHAGLDSERIEVKPNVVMPDPGTGDGSGGYAIFVGRLAREKGVETLLAAWTRGRVSLPLKMVGDGPLADLVRATQTETGGRVEWLGHRSKDEVLDLIGGAKVLLMPTQVYETFGRVVIESFAKGTPVIASNLGAVAELVAEGRTGMLFQPGAAEDLARQLTAFLKHPRPDGFRSAARAEFEHKYTAERNYRELSAIYRRAIAHKGAA